VLADLGFEFHLGHISYILAEGHLFYIAYVQTYVTVNIYHQHNQGRLMSVLVSM
jgi:hypothetical protein